MSGREAALKLIAQRDKLESEISELRDALKSHKVSVDEPLITEDGFPRHDVDVHSIRNIRVQLIRKQNDLRALLEEISKSLHNAFPKKTRNEPSSEKPNQTGASPALASSGSASEKPFAVIKSVVSNSLGDDAGLEPDDYLLKFGRSTSISGLRDEMQNAMNGTLVIRILRNNNVKEIRVNVVPGRSLGTHIVPV